MDSLLHAILHLSSEILLGLVLSADFQRTSVKEAPIEDDREVRSMTL
jgi:hypothetical protein